MTIKEAITNYRKSFEVDTLTIINWSLTDVKFDGKLDTWMNGEDDMEYFVKIIEEKELLKMIVYHTHLMLFY